MTQAQYPNGYNSETYAAAIAVRPKMILASNSKLKKDGIWNVSFPAFSALVTINGKEETFKTCPNAGACASYCYARQATYSFRGTRIKHGRNLQYLLDDPFSFVEQLVSEIAKQSKTKKLRAIRFCDAGDYNPTLWVVAREVMLRLPDVKFYGYSKQVSMFKDQKAKGLIPSNFTYVFSLGGREDHLIDMAVDRHAVIFNTRAELRKQGYTDASHSDIPASNPKTRKVALVTHGNWMALNKLKKLTAAVRERNKEKLGA